MAMSEKERKQLMGLLIAVPILGIVAFWMYVRAPAQERVTALETTVDSLQMAVDSARQELARGSVEGLRQRVREYERSLGVMRRLVPTDAEVANLIDDISNRAKIRDVHVADISPQGIEDGGAYRVARYRFTVLGNYDELGAFLSDVASLPRIMVPHRVSIERATDRDASALGDTTQALLRATFQLRTFVKQPTPTEGTTGDR